MASPQFRRSNQRNMKTWWLIDWLPETEDQILCNGFSISSLHWWLHSIASEEDDCPKGSFGSTQLPRCCPPQWFDIIFYPASFLHGQRSWTTKKSGLRSSPLLVGFHGRLVLVMSVLCYENGLSGRGEECNSGCSWLRFDSIPIAPFSSSFCFKKTLTVV